MQYIQPAHVASTTFTVSTTAGTLQSFMDVAGSADNSAALREANGIDICIEANEARVCFDGLTPTATDGLLLQANADSKIYKFRNCDLTKIRLIRDAAADVEISVQIGKTLPGQSE